MKFLTLLSMIGITTAASISHSFADGLTLSHFRERVMAKNADYKTSGPIIVVAFGDSVTMGATANGVFDPEGVYHNRLKKMLEKRFPGPAGSTLSIINSGIGGDTAPTALARIDRDVIRYQPDLVIVGIAGNDLSANPAMAQSYEASMRKIIAILREKTSADIILVTPTFMASRDNGHVPAEQHAQLDNLIRMQNGGTVAQFAEIIKKIGASENVPVADVYAKWGELAKSGVDTTAKLANGLNHPFGEMHEIPASLIMEIINKAFAAGTK